MSITRLTGLSAMIALSFWLTGCASDPDLSTNIYNHYYWGHYQIVVYEMYNHPANNSPERLSALLEEDKIKAASLNKPLPPGFHAELGYLYGQLGKTDLARQEFQLEKQRFPESALLMNRLLGYSTNR